MTATTRIDDGAMRFPFSDTVFGYVESFVEPPADDPGPDGAVPPAVLTVRAGDGAAVRVLVGPATAAEFLRNLGQPYVDASGHLPDLLRPGRPVHVHGIYYPEDGGTEFQATRLVLATRGDDDHVFEDPTWWPTQIDQIARFYRHAQFGDRPVDFDDYRTLLSLSGHKTGSHVQESGTISRLVYGMASAFMLTGDTDYLEVAEKGTEYLREHMRFVDGDEDVTYWYHGIRLGDGPETKLFTSEFSDDYDAIPAYEQIYALAGPVQTFRVTGDGRIRDDVDGTLRLFERFFRDREGGGYWSHVDPITLSPHHASLLGNRSRKNWNSVGDHAPAYLINLFLATGEERHADMLARTFDTIVERFPDDEHSPFVNERFHADWSHDLEHPWQQDRAVVGHNLKIAWNLTRMQSLRPREEYAELARRLADRMPAVGSDLRRGGWFDVVERVRREGQRWHRFIWHDRKAWWQQEQAILAYLVLAGTGGDEEHLRLAREAQSFYNAFFLDHDEGGVFFNVLADGTAYLQGNERLKGNHAMSMYHSAELCFLAATYSSLLVRGKPMSLWFAPLPTADRTLRVSPDLLPPGSVRLVEVEVDGRAHHDFDADALTVELPRTDSRLMVRVRLERRDRSAG